MQKTWIVQLGWTFWILRWFDARVFNFWALFYQCTLGYDGCEFKKLGERVFVEHFVEMKKQLRRYEREWLDWSLEDGWQPLCEFLSKDVPNLPFPSGNRVGEEFDKKMHKVSKDLGQSAVRNLGLCVVGLMTVVLGMWY